MDNPEKTLPERQSTDTAIIPETLKAQWKSWGMQIGLGVAVVLAIFLYRTHKQSNEDQASRMLGEARNVQALQAIVTQYPNTPAARLALLQTAKALCDSGDYVAASSSYAEFTVKYPKHPMIELAQLGKIECMEAMGQIPEALTAYSSYLSAHPASFLMPEALFGKARCLEQLKRYSEARAVYEDFLAAHPKSLWKNDVEENLRQLDRETRKATPIL